MLPERSAVRSPPGSRLPHSLGVGSPPSLSFFPRLPSSRLPHGLGVCSPLSLSFFPRLPGSSLPHGVGVGSPPSLSLFWLTRKAWHTIPLCKHAIDPTRPCRRGLPYRTKRSYVNMVTSHPLHTHRHQKFCSIDTNFVHEVWERASCENCKTLEARILAISQTSVLMKITNYISFPTPVPSSPEEDHMS